MLFLPIGDENPCERRPWVNYSLVGLNVLVYLLFLAAGEYGPRIRVEDSTLIRWAMTPETLEWPTLFTSMFLHGGFWHLLGNMVFLFIFGDNVEDRLGHVGYLAFYLAAGLAADGAHIAFTANPGLPTLGASGAVSGVVGAYALLYPRHKVKLLFWFYYFIHVYRIPAIWWIGFWFAEQVFFALSDLGGNVAYAAHIGGFAVGAGLAGLLRINLSPLQREERIPSEIRVPSRTRGTSAPFITMEEDIGIEFIDETPERFAVLRIDDDLQHVHRISTLTAAATGERPAEVRERLDATRGMIARDVPRDVAERIRRDLHTRGIESALVAWHRSNFPPPPTEVESVSWDTRAIRFRAGAQLYPVAWPTPFLFLGCRVGGRDLVDVFVNRRRRFRLRDSTPLTAVDLRLRREMPAELLDFCRTALERREGAALNEGIRVLAHRGRWGWLSFPNARMHDDYTFWIYTLLLSRIPVHRA